MPTLSVTKDWDNSGLPTPFIEYGGDLLSVVDISRSLEGKVSAAERDLNEYPVLNVGWRLSGSQLETFETFWEGTLNNGSATFILDLRYPKNSAVTQWAVQFVSEYQFRMQAPGRYSVEATIQLITKQFALDDRSPRVTAETVFNFVDDFEDYNNTDGTQDVAPFPTALNGGFYWDLVPWTVTLG